MANIMNVDYMAMPGQAQQMRGLGQELNSEISTAYQSISNMHTSWYGKRYNALVEQFNLMIPDINELLKLVVEEIPFAIETIANNYSQADQGTNATAAQQTPPNRIIELALSNDIGMKFITGDVEATQRNVSNNFKQAVDKMNSIESVYGTIQWQSEASEAFAARFQQLKTNIIASFENINSQFTTLMNQALEDIQTTENANTVQ